MRENDFQSEFFIDYSSLDDFQRQLIDRKNNKAMVVCGDAGSGKSLIALHKAKQLAATGESYAIVVYTKTLEKYFADGLKALGLTNVSHYHQWRKEKTRVKYMIVDECQDFSHEQIEEMKQYGEICFFFGDSAQSIMSFQGPTQSVEETALSLHVTPWPLYFNYRLTKPVAALAEKVGDKDELMDKCVRDGEKPNLIEANSFNAQLDEIIRIIRNGSLTNVGILMPFNTVKTGGNRSVEYVKDYFLNHNMTCEFKYNANMETEMDVDFHTSNPKIMTWWCAKGLQFKDVFIPGCDADYFEEKCSAVYVAMTRCSEHLYLGFSGELNSIFPSKDNELGLYKEIEELEEV